MFFVGIALISFNINVNGGVMSQFNRLMATPSGVIEIYKKSASTHLIVAHIDGVRNSDRKAISHPCMVQAPTFMYEKIRTYTLYKLSMMCMTEFSRFRL